MAIDFKTFVSVAPHVLAVKKPLMLRGRHGVGKSELVYQVASDMGLPVVERRASQMTEGDLVGLPRTDGDVTSFCPPDWLDECCNHARILFLDEVDRAIPEVRQGIFELTDSRKIFGNHLHPDTVVIAAVNGGEHGSQYQVGEMDPAELDRWTVFDVEPTTEDWLTWAKDNTETVVWDFINQNRSHLEHAEDFEPNKVYPSRRSWKRLNDCLEAAGMLGEEHNPAIFHLATGFVGFEASVSFNDFVKNYERQVTIEMILDEGQVDKTSSFNINEHCALIEKMEASTAFEGELTEDQCKNLANYFVSLPSEAVMKLWQALGSGNVDNVTRFHKAQADNGETVGSKLVTILTGK
jgi:hypothetical protein|tara:strand:+ start:656 stop:1711 length:1056 start_codon:yes stop_codon:yes gene_type:complete